MAVDKVQRTAASSLRRRRLALRDPRELLELAAEAALVRATREHPGRDRRDPAHRLKLLGDSRPVAIRSERGARPTAEEPAAEARDKASRRIYLEDLGRALHWTEVD